MIGVEDWLRYLLGLIAVLALIFVAARIFRSFVEGAAIGRRGRFRRLGIEEFLPLDNRRRLVLLRHDEREYLVLLGQQGETLLNVADRPEHPNVPDGTSQGNASGGDASRQVRPAFTALLQNLRHRGRANPAAAGRSDPGKFIDPAKRQDPTHP